MTQDEAKLYWEPARRGLGISDDFQGSVILAHLLEIKYPEMNFYWSIPMTEELRSKLKMLAGPHGKTIAAAIKARRGVDV